MTGVWATNDIISATRMNEKTIFQGSGSSINGLTTYAGMLVFCTSTGSGFIVDNYYQRDSTNSSWSVLGVDKLPYLTLSTTIGDYTAPNAAVATSEGSLTPNFSDDFSGSDAWTDNDSAKIGVNTTTDVLDFNFVADGSNDACVYDLGAGNVSDSAWTMTFKFHSTTITDGAETIFWIGLSSASQATGAGTAQDGLYFAVDYSGVNRFGCMDQDGAGAGSFEDPQASPFSNGSDHWIQIRRLTTTTYDVKVYSDSTFTTLVATSSSTCAATVTSLRYIKLMNYDAPGSGSYVGYIDDVKFYNAVTSTTALATNVYDTSTSTPWTSSSEASPAIYVDLSGSAREIVGVALNINTTLTTVTAIKVRASTDTSFADAENMMYVNISDFTDDTWRFLANNFVSDNRRYVQVIGVGTGVLSINEIKVRYGVSDLIKILTHKHRTRLTSAADSFTDSN